MNPSRHTKPNASRRGRPAQVLVVWLLLLVLFASLAPLTQEALAIPYELLSLVMLAPTLACLVVVFRPSWAPTAWPPVTWRRVLLSLTLASLAVASFVAALALLTGRSPSWPSAELGAPVALFLPLQVIGVFGEELGWRGVVQRSGEQLARPARVSAIAGFLFGATHLGYWPLGLVPVLTFSVTAMLMSMTITTIFVGSIWQRMLPAVVIHFGVNLAMLALGETNEPLATTPLALAAGLVMCGIATGAAALSRRSTDGVSQ